MPFIAAESIETSSGRMGWECFICPISCTAESVNLVRAFGGEATDTWYRYGRTRSCVLVRSGIELLREGVDDMDLVG